LNWDTLADIGTVASSIAAMFAAFGTFITVREMKKQRIEQIRPDIFISDKLVYFKFDSNKGYGSYVNQNKLPELKIANVGLGYAKQIAFSWYIDINKYVDLIKGYEIGRKYIYKYIENQSLHTEGGVIFLDNDLKQYDAVYLKDKTYTINFPFSYLEILSFLYHLYLEEKLEPSEIPSIELNVDYKDAYNNLYKRKFIITPRIFNQSLSMADGQINNYRLDIKFQVDEN